MRQRIVLLLSLLLTGAMLVAAANGPAAQSAAAGTPHEPACAREADGEQDWGTVGAGDAGGDAALPTTPGADDIVDFWVDRWFGRDLAVTDGRTIQTSHDGGCTFVTSFRLDEGIDPGSDVQPATSHVVAIEAADRPGTDRLVAVVADLDSTTVATARLRTLVSDDRGDTWRLAGGSLPQAELARNDRRCGAQSPLCQIAMSAVDPDRVYLVIPAVQGAQLWMSDDAGESFQRTYDGALGLGVSDAGPRPALEDIALDPFRPDMVWAADRAGLAVSADAGRTWTLMGASSGGLGERIQLEVAPHGDDVAIAVVTAGSSAPTRLIRSLDTGRSFSEVPMTGLDGEVTALAAGNSARDLYVADEAGAARLDVTTGLVARLGGATLAPMRHPHALHVAGLTWFATDFGLAVRGSIRFLPAVAAVGEGVQLLPFDPVSPRGQLPGRLLSERSVVQLDPGESIDVPLELVVPPAPTPVDVFFLFDESGSMKEEVDALAGGVREIVNTLRLRGLDIGVGVGGYANSYRYRRYREIGPPDAEFLDKLERLTRNGSSDEYAFTALHQVATGSGLPDTGQALAPRSGWDARWRPGTVRIVIHIGDEQLKPAPGDPDQAAATQALVDERIYHLALVSEAEARIQAEGATMGVPVTQQPWREVTRDTGAVAGPSGVDCNGDGISEVPEGGEIICFIPEVAATDSVDEGVELLPDMASVVVEVVSAVSEFHELSFHTDLPELVTLDTGTDGPMEFDIRRRVEVPLTATITCLDQFDGQVLRPRITAVAAARHLAATAIDVACGVPLVAAVAPIVEGSVPAAVGIGPAPAGAPAPPAPANPGPAGSQATSQAASQATAPGVQGAAGAVKEKSAQAQAAMIGRPTSPQDQEELDLLMPATRRRSDPTGLTLGAGAVMAVGFGVGLMRREQRRGIPNRQRI